MLRTTHILPSTTRTVACPSTPTPFVICFQRGQEKDQLLCLSAQSAGLFLQGWCQPAGSTRFREVGGDEIRGLACVLWRAHSCCRIHTDAGLPKRDSVRVGGCAYLGAGEVCVCVCVCVCACTSVYSEPCLDPQYRCVIRASRAYACVRLA